jgi:uncharacterized iron-regulated membrane protein
MNRLTRRLHRWGAVITFLPMLLVILSGLLLQVKKDVSWVQPPTKKGQPYAMIVDWDKILDVARSIEEAQVDGWSDISRLDIRPDRGLIKVFCNNHWEVQLDASTGDLLSSTYRRSDWIEQLHDGSFFSETIKRYVFLPNGLILLGLWMTGVYLWWLPVRARRRKRARNATSESLPT